MHARRIDKFLLKGHQERCRASVATAGVASRQRAVLHGPQASPRTREHGGSGRGRKTLVIL